MRAISWHLPLLCLALIAGGCKQDPLRLQQLGDSGIKLDGRWIDAAPTPDGPPSDSRVERPSWVDLSLSYDACLAIPEVCNGLDDNCNGEIDEGFDKLNDPRYCEDCAGCAWLLPLQAYPACEQGRCVIGSCRGGYVDADGRVDTGCELECTPSGLEICDGQDNDCNGLVDDGVQPLQNICNTLPGSPCETAITECQGEAGWRCVYGPGVELHPCTEDEHCGPAGRCDQSLGVCPGVVAINETLCDGIDGDCDGLIDDPWANPNLPNALGKQCEVAPPCSSDADCGGAPCVDNSCPPRQGICRDLGQYVCDPLSAAGVVCELTTPGQDPRDELCNNLDDDCDGLVDEAEDDAAGLGVKDALVHFAEQVNGVDHDFYIYSYEASRPDADLLVEGVTSHRACSKPGALPWANVSYADAQAACAAAGMRLCTGAEWLAACQGAAQLAYPYGASYEPLTCNGYDLAADSPVASGSLSGCVGAVAELYDMSGNVREWTDDQRGTTGEGDPIYVVRGGAYHTPRLGLSCDFDLSRAVGDVVLPAVGFRCCSSALP